MDERGTRGSCGKANDAKSLGKKFPNQIPIIRKVIWAEQGIQNETLELLAPATLTARELNLRIRNIVNVNKWEWGTIFFGSEWKKANSDTLYWIDKEFKSRDLFLHIVYSKENTFGSDQNENYEIKAQALPPVYFPGATFPADLESDEDDVYASTDNPKETTTPTGNTSNANTTGVLDGTPAHKKPNALLHERTPKRRKINDEHKESELTLKKKSHSQEQVSHS